MVTKNNIFFVILLFGICFIAYSQTDSLSHRSINYMYNTISIEYQIRGTGEYPIYFFYGFDDYSDAIIWENTGDQEIRKRFWTLQLAQKNTNRFITFGGGYPDDNANAYKPFYEYQLQNNRLVNFNILSYYQGKKYISRESYDIRNEGTRLVISTRDHDDGSMPPRFYIFSNISREEMLRVYITNFLKSIDYILEREWIQRNRGITISDTQGYFNISILEKEYNLEDIRNVLRILTRHELSVFRNYMYARHNYIFKTNTWNIFFRNYYNSNYNGTSTNEEVMAIMSDYEKTILNMIIEIESQRN
jgi:hypothetical protein